MVRLAVADDAEQLERLNNEFNGPGDTTRERIRDSLIRNRQEIVVVEEEDGILAGFVCVQLKKSFCYDEYIPEITEVYVNPDYRKRGIARRMITFAQAHCIRNYPLQSFELLTGSDNARAQSVYRSLGYEEDGEIHMVKQSMEAGKDGRI